MVVLLTILLVFIVIIGILGFRSAALVGIAVPGSFLLGILALVAAGVSINMMVLYGLIMAVGLLVDGAIVVTELADRRMAEGDSRQKAYSGAARRMAWPSVASPRSPGSFHTRLESEGRRTGPSSRTISPLKSSIHPSPTR